MTFFDLRNVRVRSGEEHREAVEVVIAPIELGGERYVAVPEEIPAELAVTRASTGWVFELRFGVRLHGPCVRCLADAVVEETLSLREYQATSPDSDELTTPYLVDNRLDRSTGTLRARARLENHDGALSPGQFGRAEIISSPSHKALLVPENAIGLQSTGKVLEVVAKGEDRVVERPVVLGHSFGALREISSGLRPGDRVVIAGLQGIQAGHHVAPHDSPIEMTRFEELEASR
jgi:hypothetical protein